MKIKKQEGMKKGTHETLQHKATETFVLKPFVHSPDAVIKTGDSSVKQGWSDRWTRRCGNPKYSKKTVKIEQI